MGRPSERGRVCERRTRGGLAPEAARPAGCRRTQVPGSVGRGEERREGLRPGRPGGCVREGGGDREGAGAGNGGARVSQLSERLMRRSRVVRAPRPPPAPLPLTPLHPLGQPGPHGAQRPRPARGGGRRRHALR